MIKNLITAGAYTSGNIPLTYYKNTNANYANGNNTVLVKVAGINDVKANVVLTATGTTTISAQLYANGVAVQGASASITPVSGNTYTLNINDVVETASAGSSYAELSLQLSGACTLVGGDFIVEYEG